MALYTILNVLLFSVGISAKPLSTKSMWHWRLCQKVEMAEALSSKLDQFFLFLCFVLFLFCFLTSTSLIITVCLEKGSIKQFGIFINY